ncbi:BnaC04g26650D [Brassica napus]|uniref:(rape) hypothetical protein n=1 Tax=Brassica napus TaxID=3708 RepID=A0A078FFK5_BRANA|nr:unnamed protein product [Brassica napus]CDY13170.1 BnaC04g26650D [Brassica napus]
MKKLKQIVSADKLTISRRSIQPSTVERQYTELIPVDLLIDILLRVPSKSIAWCRCVSKSWANILRLPYFTELFLRKSLNHPQLLFNFVDDGKLYFFSAPQTQNTVAYSSLVATSYHTLTLKGFSETRYLLQGLVCFQYWRRDYTMTPMVCNPVTGEFITLPKMKATLQDGVLYYLAASEVDYMIVCFNVRSEKFSYIKIDDESTTGGACTLINYEGKLGGVEFTDIDRRNLRLWLVEQDHAGKYKWSSNIYELPLSLANFYIVGMTGASDIVLSPLVYLWRMKNMKNIEREKPHHLLDPFYVFYYNVERKALTRVEIQGFQKFKRLRPRVYTFQDYLEDVKLMECL